MMRGKQTPKVSKPCVSIAFLEIAGYSSLRGSAPPADLCRMLDRLWGALDALADEHGVERVDTFDGCYMAVTNFSVAQPADHAVRLARFASAAVTIAASIAEDPQRPGQGQVRLLGGMHCGPVCGSVVGSHGGRKHTLHGDAVNVASRMESHGAAGALQCSAAAGALIEAQGGRACGLRVSEREGGVEVKSLGRMRTSWVSRREDSESGRLGMSCVLACDTGRGEKALVADECPNGPEGLRLREVPKGGL